MTTRVEVKGIPELQRKLTFLEVKAFPRAMVKTLNRTATTVRAEQSRSIKTAMGLSRVTAVKRRITIRKARRSDLRAQLEYRGRPLNLIEFRARQLKAGVKAQPWGKKRTHKGAFIVNISGNDLVFIRRRKAGGGLGTGVTPASRRAAAIAMQSGPNDAGRLPIKPMFGPGIADTAARDDIAAEREKTVARLLVERLESNLRFEVDRIKVRG